MAFVKEPKNVDFYVINESISTKERELLLSTIANLKTKKTKVKKQEISLATT